MLRRWSWGLLSFRCGPVISRPVAAFATFRDREYGRPHRAIATKLYSTSSSFFDIGKGHEQRQTESSGYFGVPGLQRPEHFQLFFERARDRIAALSSFVQTAPPSKKILYVLDEISDTLCRVLDTAEICRNVHTDAAFRIAAEETALAMSSLMFSMNSDVHLARAVERTLDEDDRRRSAGEEPLLDEEDRLVAKKHLTEFENSGISLPPEKRETVIRLQEEISDYAMMFQRNINEDGYGENSRPDEPLVIKDADQILQQIPSVLRTPFLRFHNAATNTITIPAAEVRSSHLHHTIMQYVLHPSSLRRKTAIIMNTAANDNLPILDKLLKKRLELAQVLGQESYAASIVRNPNTLAKNPEEVEHIIRNLLAKLRPSINKELDILKKAKRRNEGIPSSNSVELYPWDRAFYIGLVKAEVSNVSGLALKEYFPLGRVFDGLNDLLDRVFNIRLVPTEMMPGEAWHSSVKKCSIVDYRNSVSGQVLGHVYLDLFARPNKFPNFAMFTVRCSRQVPGFLRHWRNEIEVAEHQGVALDQSSAILHSTELSENKNSRQTPVVVLVGNLEDESGDLKRRFDRVLEYLPSKLGRPTEEKLNLPNSTRLTHSNVETIFHEFGHILHSIFSKTKYQAVSGTRAALDFVEIPSTLMEFFASDYRVVERFARRMDTGVAIPRRLFQNFKEAQAMFAGLDTEVQATYALYDMALHSAQIQEYSRKYSGSGADHWTVAMLRDIESETSSFPSVGGTHWPSKFGHLGTYGAGYYSYLWCRLYATHIWRTVFAENPLSRESGEMYRTKMLEWGGAKDPRELIESLTGTFEINVDTIAHDLKSI